MSEAGDAGGKTTAAKAGSMKSQQGAVNNGARNGSESKKPAGNHQNGDDVVVIKKYANRRLYNTGTSSYVTLDYLSEMVKSGKNFVVYDAKSGDDITRSVLTQIIFEEESKGQNLLPIQFLRQLIQFYGDSLQSFVPSYLEMSMDAFARNQEKMRAQMRDAFGAAPGYNMFAESARQNMALFEQAMKMFSPVGGLYPGAAAGQTTGQATGQQATDQKPAPAGNAPAEGATQEIEDLRAELAELRKQLSKLGDRD